MEASVGPAWRGQQASCNVRLIVSASFTFLAVLFEGSLLLIAILLGWLLGSPPLTQIRLEASAMTWGVLGTLPPLLVVLLSAQFGFKPVIRLTEWVEKNLLPLLRNASTPDLAMISLAAGVGEEALFRGVVQGALTEAFLPQTGLIGASLLFGLAHYVTRTYAVFATIFGAYLGWLALINDNLLAPIAAHALYDFVALKYLVSKRAY